MFDEAYTKLEIEEVASILDRVNKKVEGSLFDPLETTILAVDVPYYPDFRFLDIADHATNPPLQRYALQKDKDIYLLDWSYKQIYEVNQAAPITLSDKNVLDYVRFFFSYVRGRHGCFIPCESLENINWSEDLPAAERKTIGKMVEPMKISEKLKNGVYKIDAKMMLKDTLFSADVFVEPSGKVVMTNQVILSDKMPVLDNVTGN